MDVTFDCPKCKQQLAADRSLAGSEIQCPTCGTGITIPTVSFHVINPIASSAAAREEKHFSVPVHDEPTEILVQKPAEAEVLVRDTGEKTLRIKTIRRTDCVEVGHDRFDQKVSELLAKIGTENIVSINTIAYTHLDLGSRQLMTDFGVMIVYKG